MRFPWVRGSVGLGRWSGVSGQGSVVREWVEGQGSVVREWVEGQGLGVREWVEGQSV